jgi:ankyrin repeat protein
MHTQRTFRGLLIALWSLAALLPIVRGQSIGDSPLIAAAKDGDLRAVQAQIARHANVNESASDGSTALLWAAYHNDAEMVRALLAAGATADVANHYGVTPLLQASRTGDVAIIQLLLDAGAKPTRWHPDGETPLMAASRAGRLDAVKLLLARGSFVNAVDPFQEETALMWAATEGHLDIVQALLAAGADPNLKGHITTIEERKHADHATGGLTALMFAARNGHDDVASALIKGGADPKLTNGDGVTATVVAIVNDRFDLAKTLIDVGADPNDGSLYFAVDMHDATTDMRAHDGSRLRATHPNNLTSLELVRLLLDRGADANKPFVGQLHSTTLCCGAEINSSPFYRAAVAADVDVLKLMIAHGAKLEWTPAEVKKEGKPAGRGMNANVGKTPLMAALVGGRGASFAAGPGFDRQGPPPFRETSDREPLDAVKVLLDAGADPNVKAPDGSTPLHQAVRAKQVAIIRALVAAGAKLDAVNKENLTPLQVAEGPDPKPTPLEMMMMDPNEYKPKRDTKEAVIAALRELMGLGPNDPTPVPPPLPADPGKKGDEKKDDKKVDVVSTSAEKQPVAR